LKGAAGLMLDLNKLEGPEYDFLTKETKEKLEKIIQSDESDEEKEIRMNLVLSKYTHKFVDLLMGEYK
jgi:hypothetical protein